MLRKIVVCLICFLAVGCAQKPLVSVNAISSGNLAGKKYILLPANQELWNKSQLEFIQIGREVASALNRNGYVQVTTLQDADQIILLNFLRSGAVQNTRDVTLPIWGQTGVSSSVTSGTANTTLSGLNSGYGTARTTTSTSTIYNPTYGITGMYNTTVTDTSYNAGVILQSYDARAFLNKQFNLFWKSGVSMTSSNSDTLGDFKGLARIAAAYADKNIDGEMDLRIDPKTGK